MVERKDPSRFIGFGDDFDAEQFADQDLKIRQGLCPNGHGLMEEKDGLQSCPECNFTTNCKRETSEQYICTGGSIKC